MNYIVYWEKYDGQKQDGNEKIITPNIFNFDTFKIGKVSKFKEKL